jgi:hypothetical protein
MNNGYYSEMEIANTQSWDVPTVRGDGTVHVPPSLYAHTARQARDAGIRSGFLPSTFTHGVYGLHQVAQCQDYPCEEGSRRGIAMHGSPASAPAQHGERRPAAVAQTPPRAQPSLRMVDSVQLRTPTHRVNIRRRSALRTSEHVPIMTSPFVVTFALHGATYVVPFMSTRAEKATLENFENELLSVVPAMKQTALRSRLNYAYKLQVRRLGLTATTIITGDDMKEREVAFITFLNAVFRHATLQLVWP